MSEANTPTRQAQESPDFRRGEDVNEKRTITESEFRTLRDWACRESSQVSENGLLKGIQAIGIRIIEDPVPEPMNGEIALDSRGVAWMRDAMGGLWSPAAGPSSLVRDWDDLGDTHGPLRIYAEVKP